MIRSTTTSSEEIDSPYYKKHRKIALDYEQLAQESNGSIEGLYNAFFVDLTMHLPLSNGTLDVKLFEQLNFVTLDDESQDQMYTSYSHFTLLLKEKPTWTFRVGEPSFINRMFGKYTHLPGETGIALHTRQNQAEKVHQLLAKGPEWSALQVQDMRLNKRKLELKLESIPDKEEHWPALRSWFESI